MAYNQKSRDELERWKNGDVLRTGGAEDSNTVLSWVRMTPLDTLN